MGHSSIYAASCCNQNDCPDGPNGQTASCEGALANFFYNEDNEQWIGAGSCRYAWGSAGYASCSTPAWSACDMDCCKSRYVDCIFEAHAWREYQIATCDDPACVCTNPDQTMCGACGNSGDACTPACECGNWVTGQTNDDPPTCQQTKNCWAVCGEISFPDRHRPCPVIVSATAKEVDYDNPQLCGNISGLPINNSYSVSYQNPSGSL